MISPLVISPLVTLRLVTLRLATLLLTQIIACGVSSEAPHVVEAPATTAAQVDERCARYADVGDVADYCRYRWANGMSDETELGALCASAGAWSGACRSAWIEPRLHPNSGVETATLHAACGSDEDCQLDVLDHRALPNIRDQLSECSLWAPSKLRHCTSHAVDRWRESRPDAAAVAALAAEPGPGPQELGMALAEVIICDKVGTCEGGHSEVVLACVERANALRADIRRSCQRSGAPGARPQSLGGRQPLPPPPPAPNR